MRTYSIEVSISEIYFACLLFVNGSKTAGTVLKVVGASWQKTRIGTFILISAGLLVVGAFFVGYMERPKYDGTYCATAFWSEKVGFQIEYWKQQTDLLNIPKGAARICYKDSIYENGWAQIEVETQRSFPDWVQAYSAGILEGSLTWNSIYNQWLNTIHSSCASDKDAQNFCNWLRNLLTDNFLKLKELATARGEYDHYWHQISLFFSQLQGIETGYIRGATRARSDREKEITFSDFLLMNAAADIQDLKIYFENYVLANIETVEDMTANLAVEMAQQSLNNFFLPSATMLTKIFETNDSPTWQLLFGHSTAGSYASMLRIQKRYKFHYHFISNQRTNTVPGVDITFTGYPGILGSTDDFYIVKGRQLHAVVAGVNIKNENLNLWETVDVHDSVPLAARVMAANRISQYRRTWAKAMSRHPTTGAKQWITIDLHKMNPQDNLYSMGSDDKKLDDAAFKLNAIEQVVISKNRNKYKGVVWIVEQLPGRIHVKDVTESFLMAGNSTWVAHGVPYFDKMLEASEVSPDNFTFDVSPADDAKLTNLEAVDKYLRTHGFRGDLLNDDLIAYGNIDIKLYSYNTPIGMSDYHAFAGPIFIRLQHWQSPVDIDTAAAASETSAVLAALQDDRMSVVIDDAAELAELEMITERRPVRNDMRAIAIQQIGSGPFMGSKVEDRMKGIEHQGHPDEWNLEEKVSPKWSW